MGVECALAVIGTGGSNTTLADASGMLGLRTHHSAFKHVTGTRVDVTGIRVDVTGTRADVTRTSARTSRVSARRWAHRCGVNRHPCVIVCRNQ
eukprot:400454-Prorocentrum_minimum.AAC.1